MAMSKAARKAISMKMIAIHAKKHAEAAKITPSDVEDEMIHLEIPKSLAGPMLQWLLHWTGRSK